MPVSVKIPGHLADQADALIQHMQSEAVARSKGFKYRRSHVLMMTVQKGLEVLEKELTEIESHKTIPESQEATHG